MKEVCRALLFEYVEFKNRSVFFRHVARGRYKIGRLSESGKLVGGFQGEGEKGLC